MDMKHRTSRYLHNRLEQDHGGIEGCFGPMRGFKCPRSARRFCQGYDKFRNFLGFRLHPNIVFPPITARGEGTI